MIPNWPRCCRDICQLFFRRDEKRKGMSSRLRLCYEFYATVTQMGFGSARVTARLNAPRACPENIDVFS